MRKLFVGVLVTLFGICLVAAKTVDRIIAKVNDEIVTQSELNREMAAIRKDLQAKYSGEQLEQAIQKAEKQAMDSLIEEKLIYQKAVELEYQAHADTQVTEYLQQIMKDNNFKDTDELEEALAREGKSLKEYREYLERRIVTQQLVNDFINARISLLTPEIEKYYKNHLTDYTTPEEVTLSEIIITDSDATPNAETRSKDLYLRLQQGESFTTLASQYSKGPTASTGGNIGSYLLAKLNPDTVKAIAKLKEGEVSQPQKSASGYVLYRLDSRKSSVVRPLEEVKDEIKGKLYQQKRNPEYDRFMTQLREDAYIQLFLEMK
jgi:peptidyl-prolyl cis-trans isomerase SurA